MTPGALAAEIVKRSEGFDRFVVAVAGPPGSGKSTLAEALVGRLNEIPGQGAGERAALLPMDGFHLDNVILERRGLKPRKGAPETFDPEGFHRLLSAIRTAKSPVYAPVFDRELDLARAGAREIGPQHRIIVAEGNYLLLDLDPWTSLAPLFDLTVFLEVGEAELERRLVQRWLDHGHDQAAAEARARGNDMVNARLVKQKSRKADIAIAD